MPYFPLASGVLTGKYKRGAEHPRGLTRPAGLGGERHGARGSRPTQAWTVVEALDEYGAGPRSHAPRARPVVAGGSNPVVGSVIAGAAKPEQIRGQRRGHGGVAAHARGARQGRRHRTRRGLAGLRRDRLVDRATRARSRTARRPHRARRRGPRGGLDRLAAEEPRALLVLAPHGVGAEEPRPATPTGLRDPAAVLAAFPAPTVASWDRWCGSARVGGAPRGRPRRRGPRGAARLPRSGARRAPVLGRHQRLPRLAGIAAALRLLVAGESSGSTHACAAASPSAPRT